MMVLELSPVDFNLILKEANEDYFGEAALNPFDN